MGNFVNLNCVFCRHKRRVWRQEFVSGRIQHGRFRNVSERICGCKSLIFRTTT